MTTIPFTDTLSLLHTDADGIHLLLHNMFRLMKPIRRKYLMSVNSILVLNAIYLYHKYKGSLFALNGLYKWFRYFNKPKLTWYIDYLIDKGMVYKAEVFRDNQYYKISNKGIEVMNEFNSSYQSILYKWYEDNNICP